MDTDNKFGDGANTIYLKADYTSSNSKSLSTDISALTDTDIKKYKNMNPSWTEQRGIVEKNDWRYSEKAAAWLCSPSQWQYYLDDSKAVYAIGGPSIEMYVASYNDVAHIKGNYTLGAKYDKDSEGYIYTLDGKQSTISKNNYKTGDGTLDDDKYNAMYSPHSMWLCSPSYGHSYDINYVCLVSGYFANLSSEYYYNTESICPIISLKSGIQVEVEE